MSRYWLILFALFCVWTLSHCQKTKVAPDFCRTTTRPKPGQKMRVMLPMEMSVSTKQLFSRRSLSAAAYEAQLRACFQQSGWFQIVTPAQVDELKKEKRPVYGLRIGLQVITSRLTLPKNGEGLKLGVAGQLQLQFWPFQEDLDAVMLTERVERGAEFTDIPSNKEKWRAWAKKKWRVLSAPTIPKAWVKGLEGALRFAQLQPLSSAALLTRLKSPKRRKYERYIVRLLGERRFRPEISTMLGLLKEAEGALLQELVGAMARMKDKSAVLPLIDISRNRGPKFLAQLISALSEIGGDSSASYLFTLASAHPNRSIRSSANEALLEVETALRKRQRQNKGP